MTPSTELQKSDYVDSWDTQELGHGSAQNFGFSVTQNPSNAKPKPPVRAPKIVQDFFRYAAAHPRTSVGVALALVTVIVAGGWSKSKPLDQGQVAVPTEQVQAPANVADPEAQSKETMTRLAAEERVAYRDLIGRVESQVDGYEADRARAYIRFSAQVIAQESELAKQQSRPARFETQPQVLSGLLRQKAAELEALATGQQVPQASRDLAIGSAITEVKAILAALGHLEGRTGQPGEPTLTVNPADPTKTSQPLLLSAELNRFVQSREVAALATREFQRTVSAKAAQGEQPATVPAGYQQSAGGGF